MGLFLWSDAEHLSGHAVFGSFAVDIIYQIYPHLLYPGTLEVVQTPDLLVISTVYFFGVMTTNQQVIPNIVLRTTLSSIRYTQFNTAVACGWKF